MTNIHRDVLDKDAGAVLARVTEYHERGRTIISVLAMLRERHNELWNQVDALQAELDALRAENARLESYIGKLTRPW